jgi:glutamate synthase (ferredoxin)
MSGGIAYVLDEHHHLYIRLNKELVECSEVSEKVDVEKLRALLSEHYEATGSKKAKRILDNFEDYLPKFKKIIPHDYKRITEEIAKNEAKGMELEQAKIEAFNTIISEKEEA